jgi:hypothetical protein
MRRHRDAVVRGVKGLAGAAVQTARRSAPPWAWRFAIERITGAFYLVQPFGDAWDHFKEGVREELENLDVESGKLFRTPQGLLPREAMESHLREENYLPPGCDRTWEGLVVLKIEVTHPDPTAKPGPWNVLPAAMGRFTALRWETYDLSGKLLSHGRYPVPSTGYPNTMINHMAGHCAFTHAQDGPDAWSGLWD